MGRHSSESPVRGRASPPRRRSPSRRERSPTRHKNSNPEKVSSHNRSPRRSRSRSPVYRSSVREKPSNRTKSPKLSSFPSPASRSPVKKRTVTRNKSPKRVKPRSPSPEVRHSMSKSRSPESRSPSPRSRRLKRVKPEYDVEKRSRKEYERKGDRVVGEEKNLDKDLPSESEKKDRKQGRDVVNNSSRSRRETSASPGDWHRKGRRRSRSPYDADNRGRDEHTSRRSSEDGNGNDDSIAKMKAAEEKLESKEKEKQKPSFELSGKLAEETNRFRGITLLFNEPPDARKPDVRWRLYVFKGGEVLNEPLYIHRQSCYLFGRERRVVDIPTDHPSCSKQHAVLQYRQVEQENPDGTISKKVRPYLMDLGSTNKTFINDTPMEPQRYYELFEKDTIKFGNSSREYVLLHENSTT